MKELSIYGQGPRDVSVLRNSLDASWQRLCDSYLPVTTANSIWRFSRESQPMDPEQGWKLHIAATVLNAGRLLETVGPFLRQRNVLYKAPATLRELGKLNAGIFYGHTQVGKFLTIYPQTSEEAVWLAKRLHRLTRLFKVPSIPYDLQYRPDGCIYYRFGAFKTLELRINVGLSTHAIRDPEGNLVPDARDSAEPPPWVTNPFVSHRHTETRSVDSPLRSTYKAFRALAQRGKGGVYQALDLSVTPPRLCILKEGRKDGEVEWDGRDGFWRARHEGRVLKALHKAGVNVPQSYSSFHAERNYYLVTEFVEGESLEEWLCRKKRRVSIAAGLRLGVELALLVSQIHAAGWVWRDCKPRNVIRTKSGKLRPLDFEGACPINHPDALPWGTPQYVPPEANAAFKGQSRLPEDLYALGVTIYLLLAGIPPDGSTSVPLERLRGNTPEAVRKVVAKLLGANPEHRPSARVVAQHLEAAALHLMEAKS